jgi:mannosyl-oligosaccharide alpha-1,2-mannosidase
LSQYARDRDAVDAILNQAQNLADILKVAFDTSSGVPVNTLLYDPIRPSEETTNILATVGTLVLEWVRLSDKIGDSSYGHLAEMAETYLLRPQPRSRGEPFPGLLGTTISIADGSFLDSSGGWGGGTDSFYEYLIKMYLYDTTRYSLYKDRWILAVDSSIKYIASHPTSRPDLTFLSGWSSANKLVYSSGHLACFAGGNIILGGLTLDRQEYIDFGLAITDGCHETYVQTLTGIGPEGFAWKDSSVAANATNNPPPPASESGFYAEAGFWITSSAYVTRPEVIESYYYAWRATGDSKYQDWAWDAFLRINETCSAGVGFSEITNVNSPNGGSFTDKQESFLFAEVLKYAYLIQAEVSRCLSTPACVDDHTDWYACRRLLGKSQRTMIMLGCSIRRPIL